MRACIPQLSRRVCHPRVHRPGVGWGEAAPGSGSGLMTRPRVRNGGTPRQLTVTVAALMLASAPHIDAEIVGITSDIEQYGVRCLRTWQYAANIVHDANRRHNLQPPLRFSVDAQTSSSWQAAPAPFAGDRDDGAFGRSMLDAVLNIVDEAVRCWHRVRCSHRVRC